MHPVYIRTICLFKAVLLVAFFVLSTSPAMARPFKASVEGFNKDGSLLLGKGADHGLKPGMVLHLLNKKQKPVGIVTVLATQPKSASAIPYLHDNTELSPEKEWWAAYEAPEGAGAKSFFPTAMPEGVFLAVELRQRIGSQISRQGDKVPFVLKHAVRLGGTVVIKEGAAVAATVSAVQPAKGYGRSGRLELSFEPVKAINGATIPITHNFTQSAKNQYLKAAAGAYLTGFLAGGAMKGKKIDLAVGHVMQVMTVGKTRLGPPGAPPDTLADSGRPAAPGLPSGLLKKLGKKSEEELRVAMLGLGHSLAPKDSDEVRAQQASLSYQMQIIAARNWPWQVLNPAVTQKVAGRRMAKMFKNPGQKAPVEKRYDLAMARKVGQELSADFVVVGDVLLFSNVSKVKDKLGGLGLLAGTQDLVRKYYLDFSVHFMVMEVASGQVVWDSTYPLHHEMSHPLDYSVDPTPVAKNVKLLGDRYNLYNITVDKKRDLLKTAVDPLRLALMNQAMLIHQAADRLTLDFGGLLK